MKIGEIYKRVGFNVKFYRINNNKGYLTQEELSRVSRVSLSLIRRIEKGKNNVIPLEALNNIANGLNIPLYKFFI